ncbi:MAG: D-cysteine desulfhydrase family protein [Gammaproteobacteria bacterium]
MNAVFDRLDTFSRHPLGHAPTAIDRLRNIESDYPGVRLYAKRDDANGLAFGGNKVRQMEFYLGDALEKGADTLLITGAVQSNFVRLAAAAAAQVGMQCHIQLEERVPRSDADYHAQGNVLLDQMLGATLYSYPDGEDEEGADARLGEIADDLLRQGRTPYIIPLSPGHPPLGALGYVVCARELADQLAAMDVEINHIVVPSGSGSTHGGLLFGLRALGLDVPVTGICVRRDADAQALRIRARCAEVAELLGVPNPVKADDVVTRDDHLAPGYGLLNPSTRAAIGQAARREALFTDPVYSGKTFAGFLDQASRSSDGQGVLFLHTGGTPALFAYVPELAES